MLRSTEASADPFEDAEAEKAFLCLKRLVVNGEAAAANSAQPHCSHRRRRRVPSCLASSGVAAPFPCLVCGGITGTVDKAIEHARLGHGHWSSSEDAVCRTCTLCGLLLPSTVALSLHLMSEPCVIHCEGCGEPLDDEEEADGHVCSPETVAAVVMADDERSFQCPLGCEKTRVYGRDEIVAHLTRLHGCDEDVIRLGKGGAVAITEEFEFSSTCPVCRIAINTLNQPLLSHVFYRCNGRCRLLKETIKGLADMAAEKNIDPDLLVRMELESLVNEWTKEPADDDDDYARQCKTNDLKYSTLPTDFYDGYLSRPPRAAGIDNVESLGEDLPLLVALWNYSLTCKNQRGLAARSATFFRKTRLALKEDSPMGRLLLDEWSAAAAVPEQQEKQPSVRVLRRLEVELGFPVMDVDDALLMAGAKFKIAAKNSRSELALPRILGSSDKIS